MTEKPVKGSGPPNNKSGQTTRKSRVNAKNLSKNQNGKTSEKIVLDDSDPEDKDKDVEVGGNNDQESGNDDVENNDDGQNAAKTPTRPSSPDDASENDGEDGMSDGNKLKKEPIETDQEKAIKAKTLNISLEKYKMMEKEEPMVLQLMYETCVNAEKANPPSVFKELGLDDNLGYQLARLLGMSMSEFEFNMRQRPDVMQSVVLQNITSPVKETRINVDMGHRILGFLKKNMAKESARLALPNGNASMNRRPGFAGYVHPSYGTNALMGPYVSLYPTAGMGVNAFPGGNPNSGAVFGAYGTGLYSGPNSAAFSGPGPSAAGNYGMDRVLERMGADRM
jgi:hypothetical protein